MWRSIATLNAKHSNMKKITLETPEPIYKTFPFKHETIEIIRED